MSRFALVPGRHDGLERGPNDMPWPDAAGQCPELIRPLGGAQPRKTVVQQLSVVMDPHVPGGDFIYFTPAATSGEFHTDWQYLPREFSPDDYERAQLIVRQPYNENAVGQFNCAYYGTTSVDFSIQFFVEVATDADAIHLPFMKDSLRFYWNPTNGGAMSKTLGPLAGISYPFPYDLMGPEFQEYSLDGMRGVGTRFTKFRYSWYWCASGNYSGLGVWLRPGAWSLLHWLYLIPLGYLDEV